MLLHEFLFFKEVVYFPLSLTLAVVGSVLLTVLCALLFYRGIYLLWLNLQLLVSTPNHAVKLEFVWKCVCVMVMELRLGRRGVLWAECPGVKSLRWAVRCSGVWFWVLGGEGGWWRCWWIYHSRPAAPGICSSQAHFLSSGVLDWSIDVFKWTDPQTPQGFLWTAL